MNKIDTSYIIIYGTGSNYSQHSLSLLMLAPFAVRDAMIQCRTYIRPWGSHIPLLLRGPFLPSAHTTLTQSHRR